MRKIKAIALLLLSGLIFSATSDSGCEFYIPIEKGTKLTYEDYNEKDKLQGSQVIEILEMVSADDKVTINVKIEAFDKKGKSEFEDEAEYICEDGNFKVNMESVMPAETMQSMEGMEVTIDQKNLTFPSTLEAGQTLPDASISMKASMNGISVMNSNMEIYDRKVEGVESITTSAGTYECFKISSKSKAKIAFATIEQSTIDWIAPNVGNVRSETYNSKGELEGYRILSAISK